MGLSWTVSPEGYHYGIPYGYFLEDSLLNPSYGSFDAKGALLGGPIEEAGCGWGLTRDFLRPLLGTKL